MSNQLSSITKLKSINIVKFRGLKNININFGERVTVICGRNGMSKSSILGIVAQIFNFVTDYTVHDENRKLNFKTITGDNFKSKIEEHFRLSEYDKNGKYRIEIKLYDGAEKVDLDRLVLDFVMSDDRAYPRPVLRNNSTTYSSNSSRNVTHPVIFLSVKRLLPITARDYNPSDNSYISKNKDEISRTIKNILTREGLSQITATTGTISSLVGHGNNYDYQSVSVGDDNVGQIVQALFSFKKLWEEYKHYHGGILLIDEADAALFPAAQENLINCLIDFSKKYNIQVILTSHSPTIIETVYNYTKHDNKKYRVIYLSDSFGDISVHEDFSWAQIKSDLDLKVIPVGDNLSLPKINIYLEDKEAQDFFKALVTERKYTKIINIIPAHLGANNLLELVRKKVPEFFSNSIICLDGDKLESIQSRQKNIITLPGNIPPDQLCYEYLYNLPITDCFWKNKYGFTKILLQNMPSYKKIYDLLRLEEFSDGQLNLFDRIQNLKKIKIHFDKGKIREAFKTFYMTQEIQNLFINKNTNPFRRYLLQHSEIKKDFSSLLEEGLRFMLRKHSVSQDIIDSYFS